jgi:hypothetical protein
MKMSLKLTAAGLAAVFSLSMIGAASAAEPATKSLAAGTVSVYDMGGTKLHAYNTGDALGDACFIIEGANGLVAVELPSFTKDLTAWSDYAKSLKKPMKDVFVVAHATGASFVPGMTVYGNEAANKAIAGGSTKAITDGLQQAFGKDFHGGADMVQVNKVVTGPVKVAGIGFEVIDAGDGYDLVIPEMNVIYTHMLGKTTHSIMPSTAAMDGMLKTLRGYQKAGYKLVLSSHAGVEGQDAVAEKIAYVEKARKLAQTSGSADKFIADMKAAFPKYNGDNYLQMTAGFLFPKK